MSSPWLFLHFILLFVQLPACKSSSSISDHFGSWCRDYGRTYASEEERQHRLKVFEENYDYIVQHNTRGNSSYSLALNGFADLSSHEFKANYLGLSPSARDSVIRLMNASRFAETEGFGLGEESDIPPSVDWVDKGAVTSVKDQGRCDSAWAFAANGAVEGINQIVTGTLISLSAQELVDCAVTSTNDGCAGGLIDPAYEFIIQNKGIDTEEDYPYRYQDHVCNEDRKDRHIVTIDGYVDIPAKDEKKLLQAVANQPVSVGISTDRSFQFYSMGIFSGPCPTSLTSLKHAVLIVGYDSKDGKDYWIVKNSWGKHWGRLGGYMNIQRNTGSAEGICGINLLASYPIKTSPNPPPTPPPVPTMCSLFTYCRSHQICCCTWEFLWICWSWVCCEPESAECCKNHCHGCPPDYPICDASGLCLKRDGNSTLAKPFSKTSFSTSYMPEVLF